jgi:hypothetical protein
MPKKILFLLLPIVLVVLGVSVLFSKSNLKPSITAPTASESDVLGSSNREAPQIYISSYENQGYASGGVIPISSVDEPAVEIRIYGVSGQYEAKIYEADENLLLNYLIHDSSGKQLKSPPDVEKLRYVGSTTSTISSNTGSPDRLNLPIGETGIWYVDINAGGIKANAFVIRSNFGVVTKEWDNQYLFWGQTFATGKSVTGGSISVYNLSGGVATQGETTFDQGGIAAMPILPSADIAIATDGNNKSLIPLNLHYLNYGYDYSTFMPKSLRSKYFIFVDRPIYRPGDTIYFKSVLRDDDDARYTISQGVARVRIYKGWDDKESLYDENLPVTGFGTVDGKFQLPKEAATGDYQIKIELPGRPGANWWDGDSVINTASFQVEYYRKPEYFVDITGSQTEYIAGDPINVKVLGQYFSGQPLKSVTAQYQVYGGDYYDYDYYSDSSWAMSNNYRWGWWGSNNLASGTVTLNDKGIADLTLPKIDISATKSQVLSIEVSYNDATGNPAFARRNILVHSGEYGIYRKSYSGYVGGVGQQYNLPLVLTPHRSTKISGIKLTGKILRETWVAESDPNQKYPRYVKEEENIATALVAITDDRGEAVLSFTPAKAGSYKFTVSGSDTVGNTIEREFYAWIRTEGEPAFFSQNEDMLSIKADQEKYEPGNLARLTISSTIPDRDVLLTFERGRVNRYQVVHLSGKMAAVDAALEKTDIPNIYAVVSSFSSTSLDQSQINLRLSTQSKKMVIRLTPDRDKYGPGDTVVINVDTSDAAGSPISANIAVWAVDKAIYELAENNTGDIFDRFWRERYNGTSTAHSLQGISVNNAEKGGGCFAGDTPVLMDGGTTQAISSIRPGDQILTRIAGNDSSLQSAEVLGVHHQTAIGYLILNGSLRVTPNHRLWVNGQWQEAGYIQIGDQLLGSDNKLVPVQSIEWQLGKSEVYNLEIAKYQTYFAGGVWAHNQKGGGGRTVFKDTAYWNPNVITGDSGRTQLRITLPDNLTTWVVAGLGSTGETRVGQTTKEILVTKDVIVRPVVPNLLRVDDQIKLNALVQNFTDANHVFEVSLKSPDATVEDPVRSALEIKSKETEEISWWVSPTRENESTKLTFSAKAKDNAGSDTITQTIPIRSFGFWEKQAQVTDSPTAYTVRLSPDSNQQKSTITLDVAPTLLGMLPQAMKYLINYPYGCVEQTTSRFVPAVIAKSNPALFADALEGKDLDDILRKGVARLRDQQHADGGWAWWGSGPSDLFVTTYVFEYLIEAQKLGTPVETAVLNNATSYLEGNLDKSTPDDKILKIYALSLIGSDKAKQHLDVNSNLSPDIAAMAVMANVRNGDKNPSTNGLSQLLSQAVSQGDGVFWKEGNITRFGSKDASTALALRAIVAADGDRNIAAQAVRYLSRNRKFEYWSNTFSTAQVVRAVTDFAKIGAELNPDYSYTVKLDGSQIAARQVTSALVVIPTLKINTALIKENGSTLTIEKSGTGQIYSTLIVNEFRTDKNAAPVSHGLTIKREYVNAKGDQYSLAVGDIAIVNLTLSGLSATENYGIITDELPSGLIPINEDLLNEQSQQGTNNYDNYYHGISNRETTENGMVLSLYQVDSGSRTYTYKARVISEGTFRVPPASASLMYAPEIYGRSTAESVTIGRESHIIPEKLSKAVQKKAGGLLMVLDTTAKIAIGLGLVFIVAGSIILRKKLIKSKPNPPAPPQNP